MTCSDDGWEIGRHPSSTCSCADDLMSRYSGIASTIDNGEKKQFHDQIHNRGGDINLDSISTQADSWQLQRERAWQLTVTVSAIMSPVKIEFSMIIKDTHHSHTRCWAAAVYWCDSILVWPLAPVCWQLTAVCLLATTVTLASPLTPPAGYQTTTEQ